MSMDSVERPEPDQAAFEVIAGAPVHPFRATRAMAAIAAIAAVTAVVLAGTLLVPSRPLVVASRPTPTASAPLPAASRAPIVAATPDPGVATIELHLVIREDLGFEVA